MIFRTPSAPNTRTPYSRWAAIGVIGAVGTAVCLTGAGAA